MVFRTTYEKISEVIHIILDNAKIHMYKKVDEFFEKHKRVKLHYLPLYAPDINPVELFNNVLKSNIRHQKAMNAEELKEYAILTNYIFTIHWPVNWKYKRCDNGENA